MHQLIFVYGSLKRGFRLHHLLEDQEFVSQAVTVPTYLIFDLGEYPGLIEAETGFAIRGEVYRVDPECLALLDEAEGVAEGLYTRREIHLQAPFAEFAVHAWHYCGNVSGFRRLCQSWPD